MDRLDQITTFVRVVELGGFAAAARDLDVAPSVVTTQIQALEQRLGARLLNRNTRSVQPTEVGEAYYARCLDLLKRFELADDFVQSMQAIPRGVLRLNVSLPLVDLITPVVSRYASQYREASVRMIVTGRDLDLIEDHFDLAVRHRVPDNASLIVRKIGEFGMVACAAPTYFAGRPKPEKPADLLEHNCLIYTDSGSADRWPVFSTDSDMSLHGNLHTNSTLALIGAAESGQGIVVLPEFAAARALDEGRLVAILRDYTTVRRPVTVVYPHRGLAPTKTTAFVDMLTKHIPQALSAASCDVRRQDAGADGSETAPDGTAILVAADAGASDGASNARPRAASGRERRGGARA
jgi:DNA-binding transcriptional LysR family regulator